MKLLSVMRKEALEVAHDRTMLAVLLVFPVFIMVFMGSSFHSMEITGLPVGVVGATNTSFSAMLFSGLNGSSAFNLQEFPGTDAAMTAFRNGQLRAVIVVPDDFDSNISSGSGAQISIIVDNSDLALEQSILTAMSSVIEASSANITRSYVNGAWTDLKSLNSSAAGLSSGIATTRARMLQTKDGLAAVRAEMDGISIDALEGSLDNASRSATGLSALVESQKAALGNVSANSEELFNNSDAFVYNATVALNQSLLAVADTHGRLAAQAVQLNSTVSQLDVSIAGLSLIESTTGDNVTRSALDLNIAGLRSLRNTTAGQLNDTEKEVAQLEALNTTLNSFGSGLSGYSEELAAARAGAGGLDGMEVALDNVSITLAALNSSFSGAREETGRLRGLLSDVNGTIMGIDGTLDSALSQTSEVDSLISSLESTVADQTGRDPGVIASPLSVKIQAQYTRASFVDFIMPQVIAVSLLLSCFLLGSISLVREKTRRTIVRALMVNDALPNLVAGKIMTLVLLSFGQVVVILLVAALLFGVKGPSDWGVLVWGTMISSLALSSIGVLVGFYARSESAAVQVCLLLAIPMLFLGNIIFSPDLLPKYTQVLQEFLPLAHVTSIFKVVLITGGNPAVDVAALLSYLVLLAAVLGYIVFQRRDLTDYN